MRKIVAVETIIVLVTVTIVLSLLAFSFFNDTTVSKHEEVRTGQMDLIYWTLESGQRVSGSLNYSLTSFTIVNPNSEHIYNGSIVNGHGNFSFTADIDGQYTLLSPSIMWNNQIDYTYTVTTPIFGLDSYMLIGLTIVSCTVLVLIIALIDYRKR